METHSFNRNGGLTLVPATGFGELSNQLKIELEQKGSNEGKRILVDIVCPTYGHHPSGEPFLELTKEHIGGHDVIILTSGPGTERMITETLFLLGYVSARRPSRITLITCYFPLSRSDKDEGGKRLALPPLIIELFKKSAQEKLDRIISFNLHSPQVVMAGNTGLITPLSLGRRILTKTIEDAIEFVKGTNRKICLYYPDDGSAENFEDATTSVCEKTGVILPKIFGVKRRKDSNSCHLKGIHGDIGLLNGSLVIGMDDEGATMGTSIEGAGCLKEQFRIYQYWSAVIHPVLCGNGCQRLTDPQCAIDRTYCTNTIPTEHRPELEPLIASGRLRVISLIDDLTNIIYYHHEDTSIRELR